MVPTAVAIGSLISVSYLKENEEFYTNVIMPSVHKLMDGEQAHNFAIKMTKFGFVPNKVHYENEDSLVKLIFSLYNY